MKRALLGLVAWCGLATTATALAVASVEPIAGTYVAEKNRDHKIELFFRERVLCGRITWTKETNLLDARNRDTRLRARKVAGIEHIRGFTKSRSDDGTWTGGTLYNPEDGRTYDARLWLDGNKRLIIQGRPKVPLLGGVLGALFGRIAYLRETEP